MNSKKKWYCTVQYVHLDTGEMITKSRFLREHFYIVDKEIKYELKENYNNKIILYHVRESKQIRLFD